jgi:hypothetical protein
VCITKFSANHITTQVKAYRLCYSQVTDCYHCVCKSRSSTDVTQMHKKPNSVASVGEQTIPTSLQLLVSEVGDNFCRQRVLRGQRNVSDLIHRAIVEACVVSDGLPSHLIVQCMRCSAACPGSVPAIRPLVEPVICVDTETLPATRRHQVTCAHTDRTCLQVLKVNPLGDLAILPLLCHQSSSISISCFCIYRNERSFTLHGNCGPQSPALASAASVSTEMREASHYMVTVGHNPQLSVS